MLPYFSGKFGNAASKTHAYGWIADEGVEQARKQLALLLQAEPQEIVFTSGATEGCNLALKGTYEMYGTKGRHIIAVATEHKAVLDTCRQLQRRGAEVTYLAVDNQGLVDMEALAAAIRPDTFLIAVMYANNETGVLQPIAEIGRLAKQHGVLFFTDATQAAGKLPLDVNRDQVDILALSAHKFYGPKGVGALYVRRRDPRVRLLAQMDGGGHERGFRSGTLNVPGIVGLGKAAALAMESMDTEEKRLRGMRDHLERSLLRLEGAMVNGNPERRMGHVTNLSFAGIKAERLIAALNSRIAFSVGSACTSASREPSHVLEAMALGEERIKGSIRLSLGKFTTEAETDQAIAWIAEAVKREKA